MKQNNYIITNQDVYDIVNNVNGGDPNNRTWYAKSGATLVQDKRALTRSAAEALLLLDSSALYYPTAANKLIRWDALKPNYTCGSQTARYNNNATFLFDLGTTSGTVDYTISNKAGSWTSGTLYFDYGGTIIGSISLVGAWSITTGSFTFTYDSAKGTKITAYANSAPTAGDRFDLKVGCPVASTPLYVTSVLNARSVTFTLKNAANTIVNNPSTGNITVAFDYADTSPSAGYQSATANIAPGANTVTTPNIVPNGFADFYETGVTPASWGSYTFNMG